MTALVDDVTAGVTLMGTLVVCEEYRALVGVNVTDRVCGPTLNTVPRLGE